MKLFCNPGKEEKMAKMLNSKLKLILIIVIVLVILFTGGIIVFQSGISAVDPKNEEPVTIEVPSGSGASSIVYILDDAGLVKNMTFAKVQARIGRYNSLQANTYVFNKSMTLTEMFNAINTGDFEYLSKQKFTIVEGTTIPQVAEAMAAELPFSQKEIIAKWSDAAYLKELVDEYWFLSDDIFKEGIMYPLEGYIYPETYFVSDAEPTIESVTAMMLEKTEQELAERETAIKNAGMSVHEFLTLSSVVENESLFEADRPKIAGVFVNRLEQDIPLQSDITVLYALQEKRVDVTYDDLEVDSPYNTYKYAGLPVGPVCAVPAHTMDDVLNYEKTDYLYFFATEDGKVLYSKTVEEHNKIVEENLWY